MASTFKDVVDKLQTRLAKNSVYSYWLRFEAGELVLDTSANNGVNLFISFENRKSGVGKANCFTLNIAYAPKVTFTNDKFGDPNYIDRCLVKNISWECKLKYGYDHNPDDLVTKEYTGLILNYTKEINNGMLFYTITGYSNLVENCEDKVTIEPFEEEMRSTEAAKLILEEHVEGYTVEIDDSAKGKDEMIKIEGAADVEVFNYVINILRNAKDADNSKELRYRPYYTFIVDDIDKKIRIVRVDENSGYDTQIIFNWMDQSNSIVQSFKPKYDGTVLRTLYKDELSKSTSTNVFNRIIEGISNIVNNVVSNLSNFMFGKSNVINQSGKTTQVDELKESIDVASTAESDLRIEQSVWAEAIRKNTYTATMITVGIPYDIAILSKIEVVPLIYGNKDLSAGYYMITEVTDNIDSSGFTTTMEMMRVS